jgi:RHS repeat-associated protein
VASGTTSYYGYDAHGDVRSLMNNGGVVTDTYDYDAFGNVVGSTGTTPNVYRYQGEAFDSETGLYYMRARYYDPTVGRFLNVDQMTDQGEHPYSYAAADPVNGHDPTGTQDVIEYSLLMWLYTAHVPPPRGYMSCQGGILFSGTGAGSGGGSGMQADASAGATMARLGLACQLGGKGPGRSGNPPQPPKGSCCDEARKPPLSIPALSPIINNRTHALTPNPC